MLLVLTMQNISDAIIPACREKYGETDLWRCLFAPVSYTVVWEQKWCPAFLSMESPDREVPLYLTTEVSLAWRVQIERFLIQRFLSMESPDREVSTVS